MRQRHYTITAAVLAVLMLLPAVVLGMSETFCTYQHNQFIQYNITLMIQGSQTSWQIRSGIIPAVPRPEKPIARPAEQNDAAPAPLSLRGAMLRQIRLGSRVAGVLVRVAGRAVKQWLRDQITNINPLESD